jgi:hypothetical protein
MTHGETSLEYGARMQHDDEDLLEGGHVDDESEVGSVLRDLLAPEALALASLVLAVVSVLGLGLLNGSPYLPSLYSGDGPTDSSVLVLAALLGAALALLPAALGVVALRRLPLGSSSRTTAAAGVLVAGVSCGLRVVLAVRNAVDDSATFVQF